jgi:hypothetical protein
MKCFPRAVLNIGELYGDHGHPDLLGELVHAGALRKEGRYEKVVWIDRRACEGEEDSRKQPTIHTPHH